MHPLSVAFLLLSLMSATIQDVPPTLLSAMESHSKSSVDRRSVRHALVELTGDDQPDAVVLLEGTEWCGSGGCTMLVFRGTAGGFIFVSRSTITYEPIRVLPEKTRGWNTLIVYSKGKGDVLMRFDGTRYPLNPSLQPKATPAQIAKARTLLQ